MRRLVGIGVCLLFLVVTAMPMAYGEPAIGSSKPKNLTPEELEMIGGLDYDHAWGQLEYLSALGEKTAGSDEETSAQEYVFGELSKMPLNEVWWQPFKVDNWEHFGTTVTIVNQDREVINATTYGDSPSVWGRRNGTDYYLGNMDGGKVLLADVVDVGYGSAEEFEAAGDITGMIALVHRDDNLQGWPNVPAVEAALAGASAVMLYGYYTGVDNPEGIKQDSVFSSIPAISISPNSAARLQELMADGPVTLEISGRVDFHPSVDSVNVAGVLYGTTRADEYVVISGHIDTWWWGSFDDSSSVAIMLEMARAFSSARASGQYVNERTLVFCSVGAEESGGVNGTWFNWLIGSYEFVCEHPTIMDGLVMELNIDGGSYPKEAGKVWLEVSCEASEFTKSAIFDLGYLNAANIYTPVWTWTDAWSFAGKGGGTAIEMVWGSAFDYYYHTQLDTIELQSQDMVGMIMELTALMAFRAVGALVIPIDLGAAADWAGRNLACEKPMVPSERETIDRALAALSEFKSAAAAASERAAEIEEMYASTKSRKQREAATEMADELNRALIDARRVFIPWTMGEGGMMASWEPLLRSHQHATDHAAVTAAINALDMGSANAAIEALEGVRSMEWGKYCSRGTYLEVYGQMMYCFKYWGDDFDQAQDYIDIQGVYLGLKDGSMYAEEALEQLEWVRDNQLLPWYAHDVQILEWAWALSSQPLAAVVG